MSDLTVSERVSFMSPASASRALRSSISSSTMKGRTEGAWSALRFFRGAGIGSQSLLYLFYIRQIGTSAQKSLICALSMIQQRVTVLLFGEAIFEVPAGQQDTKKTPGTSNARPLRKPRDERDAGGLSFCQPVMIYSSATRRDPHKKHRWCVFHQRCSVVQ